MRRLILFSFALMLVRCTTPIKTPSDLREALIDNRIRSVRRAVREGYPLDREVAYCFPPLPFAAAMDRAEIALAMVDARPDPQVVNQANCMGLTALHFARLNRDEDFARALIERGADQTLRDGEGHTAADYETTPRQP